MSTQYIESAHRALRIATESVASKAQVKKELTQLVVPPLRSHIAGLKNEVARFQRGSTALNIEDAPSELRDAIYDLRGFLVAAESRLNAKVFKNAAALNFGTDLKNSWMRTVFKDADDVRCICELTNANAFENEQAQIVSTVRNALPLDGAKAMLAQCKVALSAPSKGSERQLMHVMNNLLNAERYELLSKVDLYIRSEHAQNDFSAGNKKTQKLREAFSAFENIAVGSIGYTQALETASNALYARFDDVFFAASVRFENGKNVVKVHGTLAEHDKTLAKNRTMPKVGFVCERTAPSKYIDSFILNVKKDTIFSGLATANDKTISLLSQGEQLARQLSGINDWVKKDLNIDLKGKRLLGLKESAREDLKIEVISIIRATHHDEKPRKGSQRETFFNQIGVQATNKIFVTQLDKLQALTVLVAVPHAEDRCKTRFLFVAKELEWDIKDYIPSTLASAAIKIIKPILEKFGHPDFYLQPNSSKASLVNQVAESVLTVIHQFADTPEMKAEKTLFCKIAQNLTDTIKKALVNKDAVIYVNDMKNLSSALSTIEEPAITQELSMDMS